MEHSLEPTQPSLLSQHRPLDISEYLDKIKLKFVNSKDLSIAGMGEQFMGFSLLATCAQQPW